MSRADGVEYRCAMESSVWCVRRLDSANKKLNVSLEARCLCSHAHATQLFGSDCFFCQLIRHAHFISCRGNSPGWEHSAPRSLRRRWWSDSIEEGTFLRACMPAGISCKRRGNVLWADACVHDRQENERRICPVPGG